jgi:hypothetical protein
MFEWQRNCNAETQTNSAELGESHGASVTATTRHGAGKMRVAPSCRRDFVGESDKGPAQRPSESGPISSFIVIDSASAPPVLQWLEFLSKINPGSLERKPL